MTWKAHTAQAIIVTAIMSFWLDAKEVVILFLSIIFIDVDHYFDYAMVCRRFNIKDMFKYHNWVWKQRNMIYGLSIFHTLEVFILLFLLGFLSYYFWIILLGFLLHMLFDLISLYKYSALFTRAFSIVEYIVRKRNINKGYPIPDHMFWD